jgi:hypothetical protein
MSVFVVPPPAGTVPDLKVDTTIDGLLNGRLGFGALIGACPV